MIVDKVADSTKVAQQGFYFPIVISHQSPPLAQYHKLQDDLGFCPVNANSSIDSTTPSEDLFPKNDLPQRRGALKGGFLSLNHPILAKSNLLPAPCFPVIPIQCWDPHIHLFL